MCVCVCVHVRIKVYLYIRFFLFNSLLQCFVLLPEVACYLLAHDQCLVGFSEIKDWKYFFFLSEVHSIPEE